MKYVLIFNLLIMASCSYNKHPHSYFSDCEKKFSEFTNLSSCALKQIEEDCDNVSNCQNEDVRFVDIIKRLQIMVDNNEISDNEAMFRYYNLIDFEESKFRKVRNTGFSNYHYYWNDFNVRGNPPCYFSRTSFCY